MAPWLLLAAVWLLSAFYLGMELKRGWLPHDEGVLAQSAERVLLGEIPHKDFDEIYTGGLSYLNAEAFRLFGTNLASMRYMLYLFFVAWVPCLYFVASRFGAPWVAAAFTLLAVAWSVPNYTTAMPSWYNLFFATFGVAALFRHLETRHHRWLFVAGLCGGISFLFKLSGLYYVAGAVLFLWYVEGEANERVTRRDRRSRVLLATLFVLAYELSVLSLLSKVFYPGSFLYFFLPVLAIGVAVIWQQLRPPNQGPQFSSEIAGNLLLFSVGVAIPVLLFLIPYLRAGAVADFLRGVFVLPGKRLHFTVKTQSLPRFLAGVAADTLLLIAVFKTPKKIRGWLGSLLVVAGLGVGVLARKHPALYDAVWVSVWNFLPVVILVGVLVLIAQAGQIRAEQRQKVFLLLAVTAACSLVQFPYSAQIYFCYVAPLLIVSVMAVCKLFEDPPQRVLAGLFCVCLLYALLVVTPRFKFNRRELNVPRGGKADFVLPRAGGLHLYGEDAKENADVVEIVVQHARGRYIYATPDCPQVYFLSGFRNPTPTMFDFLDEQVGRTRRILDTIHAHDINVVVINLAPGFSGPVPPDLRSALDAEFPEQASTAHYEVRWKP
jgi:hypothetical protein